MDNINHKSPIKEEMTTDRDADQLDVLWGITSLRLHRKSLAVLLET
jgi:hypothetical protein